MATKKVSSRKSLTLGEAQLRAVSHDLPKTRHRHPFAADRVPPAFHITIDPDKHPPQPWKDLPPAPALPPFRLNLDAILDPETLNRIKRSEKLVLHSVGDTGGVNTPSYIEAVSRLMECDFIYTRPPDRPSLFYHLGDLVYGIRD